MTKRRRAILIESGNIAMATPLPGAAQDVKNWIKYLQSPLGGCWNAENEIISMSQPSLEDLQTELLKLCGCDYAFIAFSGHGGYNVAKSEDFIFLNNDAIITVDHIIGLVKNIVDKVVVVIDACRDKKNPPANFVYSNYQAHAKCLLESVHIPLIKYDRKVLLESGFLSSYCKPTSANADDFQSKWWKILDSKPKGVVLLQSCSQGEKTAEGLDGVQQFGLFSRSIIDAAYNKSYSDSLSINEAFDYAKGQVRFNTRDEQIPEISYPCQEEHTDYEDCVCEYPFSVKKGMHKTFRDFYNESVYDATPCKNFYDGKQILLEYQTYKPITGTRKSYRIDKASSFTHVQKHAHVFAKPNGEGKELYAVNLDGTGHDGSKYQMEPYEINFFKDLGFKIPDNGLIECRTFFLSTSKDELFILLG